MSADYTLQGKCEHPKAIENLRTETEQPNGSSVRVVILRHMYCPRCGMFFAREVWS